MQIIKEINYKLDVGSQLYSVMWGERMVDASGMDTSTCPSSGQFVGQRGGGREGAIQGPNSWT